jgi:hypothetical protein
VLDAQLSHPTDERLFYIISVLDAGYSIDRVHHLTTIDKLFLSKLARISTLRKTVPQYSLDSLTERFVHTLKVNGFSDRQIVTRLPNHVMAMQVRAFRKDGSILNYAMSENVENAGVHSGQTTLVLPAQKLYVGTIQQVKRIASSIAQALNITGPFNIQLMARANDVKVIECNLCASRTFPFTSKTFDLNFINLDMKAMIDLPVFALHGGMWPGRLTRA